MINALAAEIHRDNDHWWRDPATRERIKRDKETMLLLLISEVIEAFEAERKDKMDDHLPEFKGAVVELADAVIRMLDYCGAYKYDLDRFITNWYPMLASRFDLYDLMLKGRIEIVSAQKPNQLMAMVNRITLIADLEMAGVPTRDVESQFTRLLFTIFGYCGVHNYDLPLAIAKKRGYNATRQDHSFEARQAQGGKKW